MLQSSTCGRILHTAAPRKKIFFFFWGGGRHAISTNYPQCGIDKENGQAHSPNKKLCTIFALSQQRNAAQRQETQIGGGEEQRSHVCTHLRRGGIQTARGRRQQHPFILTCGSDAHQRRSRSHKNFNMQMSLRMWVLC